VTIPLPPSATAALAPATTAAAIRRRCFPLPDDRRRHLQ